MNKKKHIMKNTHMLAQRNAEFMKEMNWTFVV